MEKENILTRAEINSVTKLILKEYCVHIIYLLKINRNKIIDFLRYRNFQSTDEGCTENLSGKKCWGGI